MTNACIPVQNAHSNSFVMFLFALQIPSTLKTDSYLGADFNVDHITGESCMKWPHVSPYCSAVSS